MSGFVGNSKSDLIAAIKLALVGRKPSVKAVYSKFNLKILLFLASRGFVSAIKVRTVGAGAVLEFIVTTAENGGWALNNIWSPRLTRGRTNNRMVQYRGWRDLVTTYGAEFVVVSTSRGMMTALEAVNLRVGGLVVCIIN